MNTTFKKAISNLSVSDYDYIDEICLMLKARKKEIRLEKSEILKTEKEAQKTAAKVLKEKEKAVIKAHNQAKKQQEKTHAQTIRIAEKAKKAAEKASEKAEKDSKKKAEKDATTLAKLQLATLKHSKKNITLSPKSKNSTYHNFTKWAKSDDGPSEELINAAGGKREWLKTEWASLTNEQKSAIDAPWNIIV